MENKVFFYLMNLLSILFYLLFLFTFAEGQLPKGAAYLEEDNNSHYQQRPLNDKQIVSSGWLINIISSLFLNKRDTLLKLFLRILYTYIQVIILCIRL